MFNFSTITPQSLHPSIHPQILVTADPLLLLEINTAAALHLLTTITALDQVHLTGSLSLSLPPCLSLPPLLSNTPEWFSIIPSLCAPKTHPCNDHAAYMSAVMHHASVYHAKDCKYRRSSSFEYTCRSRRCLPPAFMFSYRRKSNHQ